VQLQRAARLAHADHSGVAELGCLDCARHSCEPAGQGSATVSGGSSRLARRAVASTEPASTRTNPTIDAAPSDSWRKTTPRTTATAGLTYLAAQFRRFKRRFGTKGETKAIFAVAHTMIVIVWHLLASDAAYDDLGADFFERRINTEARQRHLVRQLEALGHKVTLQPAA
jgi:hypothetical protein